MSGRINSGPVPIWHEGLGSAQAPKGWEKIVGTQENASAETVIETAARDINSSLHAIDVESLMTDLGHRLELAVKRALTSVQTQSKTYMNEAEARIETAEHYVAEQVRAKPVTAMATAIAAGVLVGLLLSSGRKR